MLTTMMDRIARFLYGRYGSDQLNIALIIFSLVISIVMRFTPVWSRLALVFSGCFPEILKQEEKKI